MKMPNFASLNQSGTATPRSESHVGANGPRESVWSSARRASGPRGSQAKRSLARRGSGTVVRPALAERPRRYAERAPNGLVEQLKILNPHVTRHLLHGQIGMQKQMPSAVEPAFAQIVGHGLRELTAEQPRQMRGRNPSAAREPRQLQRLGEPALNDLASVLHRRVTTARALRRA